jgi:hypothetical protein
MRRRALVDLGAGASRQCQWLSRQFAHLGGFAVVPILNDSNSLLHALKGLMSASLLMAVMALAEL